jgi:transposase
MTTDGQTVDQWLEDAEFSRRALTAEQRAVLEAGFEFLRRCGGDYYSLRILSHFLLNSGAGFKVAQVARLVGVSRQTASRQRKLSSKEVVQSAHHRMAGRPYGKLLPRYAGSIAQFLVTHPHASRSEIIDFIGRTWGVRVSTVALHRFMKKYGLDRAQRELAAAADGSQVADPLAATPAQPPAAGLPVPLPAEEFFLPARSTPVPSCSCPTRWTGWPPRKPASMTTTARLPADC